LQGCPTGARRTAASAPPARTAPHGGLIEDHHRTPTRGTARWRNGIDALQRLAIKGLSDYLPKLFIRVGRTGHLEELANPEYSVMCGLAGARSLAAAADRLERYYVAALRTRGVSWMTIGTAAAITRQSAHQHYG
jgi:hypothetical protein